MPKINQASRVEFPRFYQGGGDEASQLPRVFSVHRAVCRRSACEPRAQTSGSTSGPRPRCPTPFAAVSILDRINLQALKCSPTSLSTASPSESVPAAQPSPSFFVILPPRRPARPPRISEPAPLVDIAGTTAGRARGHRDFDCHSAHAQCTVHVAEEFLQILVSLGASLHFWSRFSDICA